MKKSPRVGIVIPDVHAPFHHRQAVRTFLRSLVQIKPDFVVNIGDFIDSYSMSRHTKDPRVETLFKNEVRKANALLDEFEAAIGKVKKYWTLGNHDIWVEQRVKEVLPGATGMLDIQDLLKLDKRGWEVVDFGDYLQIGKCLYSHTFGHYGINGITQTAHGVGYNCVYGDSHHAGVAYLGTSLGDRHVTMNVGWLGDRKYAKYMPRHKTERHWQHGFGLVHLDDDGTTWAHFVPIIHGRCIIPGPPQVVRG